MIALLQGTMKDTDDRFENWASNHNPIYSGQYADITSMLFFGGLCVMLYLVGRELLLGPKKPKAS